MHGRKRGLDEVVDGVLDNTVRSRFCGLFMRSTRFVCLRFVEGSCSTLVTMTEVTEIVSEYYDWAKVRVIARVIVS